MSNHLLNAIGATNLIEYFELLDDMRKSGRVNMAGAARELQDHYPGMGRFEARTIARAWRDTFTETLPADDRALNALEIA